MKIITNYEKVENDLYDVMHLFYPDSKLDEEKPMLKHVMERNKNIIKRSL